MYTKGTVRVGEKYILDDDMLRAVIYLPHSCDEWVIGGKKEAKQLIRDLGKAIEQLGSVLD